jgi:aspartyl-tRNA(Asn)/glutamyl-tRNA(Gln) amidotransferase subunit C
LPRFENFLLYVSNYFYFTRSAIFMSLTTDDIHRLAKLARIDITTVETERTLTELNNIFSMVETLQAVDTEGLVPLCHPIDTIQQMQLRLRDDVVTETDARDANMANAPQKENGLFLVPKVLE